MSRIGVGFDALFAACERLSIPVTAGPPRADVPADVLGQPLDATLRAVFREHDGMWWSAPEFSLRIYPLEGADAFEWRNLSLRRSSDDYVPPYPFESLLVFAQYGRRASYLATVPSLADAAGRQPVLYLDTHEDPWAVPVAASVDAAFGVLAEYLARARLQEVNFPLDVADLISSDAALASRVTAKEFDAWTRGDASLQEWLQQTFKRGA